MAQRFVQIADVAETLNVSARQVYGLVKSGENGRGLTSRWYAETLAKRIETIRGFRHKITFEHGDALEAIQQHTGATMFVDPPYTAGSGKRAGQGCGVM